MTPISPDDLHARLDRVAAGDPRATREFVDEFTAPVLALLRGFHQLTDEDRQELAQDALLAAITSLHRYDRQRRFVTWLLSIAKHKALHRLRDERTEWVAGEWGAVPAAGVPLREELERGVGEGWPGGGTDRGADDAPQRRERPDAYDVAVATEADGVDGDDAETGEAADVGGSPDALGASGPRRIRGGYRDEELAEVRGWVAGLSAEERIVATHFTHDVPYPAVAAKLTEVLGRRVTPGNARVKGTRFAAKVRERFGHRL